jgi:hypothetical protein
MKNTNYIIRTINGKRYGFKATRVILNGNDYSQKVYGFGTEFFPSGSRVMVRVWDKAQNRMIGVKLARCVMVEALITNLETEEQFTWNGEARNIG